MNHHLPKPPPSDSQPSFVFGLLVGVVTGSFVTVIAAGIVLRLMIPPELWTIMSERSTKLRIESDLSILARALESYRHDHGAYPTPEQGLKPLIEQGRGKYIGPVELPKDPWGRDYVYRVPGETGTGFEILTYGRDGRPGGSGIDGDRHIGPVASPSHETSE